MEPFRRGNNNEHQALVLHQTEEELKRELRDARPAHFLWKINNFSFLSSSNPCVDKYESTVFEIGGYKWKLCVHPKGNKKANEDKHLSLYLVLSKSNGFTLHQEVNVYFKLFVYNQNQDMYLTLQDAKWRVKRFRGSKTEWGFNQVIPINFFNDGSNGYLIDDCCIFGAEVFVLKLVVTEAGGFCSNNNMSSTSNYFEIVPEVLKQSCKGECVTFMNKELTTHTWNVQNLLERPGQCCQSNFVSGGLKWTLMLYPVGWSNIALRRKCVPVLLCLDYLSDHTYKPQQWTLSCDYIFRVKNQLNDRHYEVIGNLKFTASSRQLGLAEPEYMPLTKVTDTEGYVVNNCMIVELEFSSIVMFDDFF